MNIIIGHIENSHKDFYMNTVMGPTFSESKDWEGF